MTFNPETFRELAGKITKGPIAESDKATAQYFAYCFTHAQEIAALAEENARLREALTEIYGLAGEINPSNYDHDDVCYLNAQFIETGAIARAALERKPHE